MICFDPSLDSSLFSVVRRGPHQVRQSSLWVQLWSGAQVHLAGGDREETLQHGLCILQVGSTYIFIYLLLYIVYLPSISVSICLIHSYSDISLVTATPPLSTWPTEASVSATPASSSAPRTTTPRGARKTGRSQVRFVWSVRASIFYCISCTLSCD